MKIAFSMIKGKLHLQRICEECIWDLAERIKCNHKTGSFLPTYSGGEGWGGCAGDLGVFNQAAAVGPDG